MATLETASARCRGYLPQGNLFELRAARRNDGGIGLAVRPKVAGAQAVAAGSNHDDVRQKDRQLNSAAARVAARFKKGGRQHRALTGASRRGRMLMRLFCQCGP